MSKLSRSDWTRLGSGNKWTGSVISSEYRNGEIVVTVKIVGQPLTVISTNVSDCVHRPIQPEDQVGVSIEAAAMQVVPVGWPPREHT